MSGRWIRLVATSGRRELWECESERPNGVTSLIYRGWTTAIEGRTQLSAVTFIDRVSGIAWLDAL